MHIYWGFLIICHRRIIPLFNGMNTCDLTHCGLVTPYGTIGLGQHWVRLWLASRQQQIYYTMFRIMMTYVVTYHGWVRKHFPNMKGVLGSQFFRGVLYTLSLYHPEEKRYDLWRVYSNQCWLITSGVLWHASNGNFIKNAPILDINLVITQLRLQSYLQGAYRFKWPNNK